MENSATMNKLEDVPLPTNNQQQQLASDDNLDDEGHHVSLPSLAKPNSRTNSLKRFFKINKKGEKEATEGQDEDNMKSKSENNFSKGIGKKFHLRLGHFNKHANTDGDAPKPSTAAAAAAGTTKPTLKGSLSNYWNAIFKKGKKHTGDADADSATSSAASDADDEIEDGKHKDTADDNDTDADSSARGNPTSSSPDREKNMDDNLTAVANEIHALTVSDIENKDGA